MQSSVARNGILFGLGNPLLDITARPEAEFLQKYNLHPNGAILAEEQHVSMYDEMLQKYQVEYSAGGSVLNAARVVQWAVGIPQVFTYTGCIGVDKFGDTMLEVSRAAGVNVQFMRHPTESTGKCAVLVMGVQRSLCAYLGAASCFEKSHLLKPEMETFIRKADYFYIEGYHLAVSIESILHLAEYASTNDKVFAINLNAPYLVTVYKENMMKTLPYVDIIICNEDEAETFSEEHEFGTKDLRVIASMLLKLAKVNKKRERIAIITQGKLPVIVAHDDKIEEFAVPEVPVDNIIDTNGAGDGFAGGFFAMFVQGKPLDVCVRCGIYAASEIIQRDGCTLPAEFKFQD